MQASDQESSAPDEVTTPLLFQAPVPAQVIDKGIDSWRTRPRYGGQVRRPSIVVSARAKLQPCRLDHRPFDSGVLRQLPRATPAAGPMHYANN